LKHRFEGDFGNTRLHEISPLGIDKWRGKKLAEGLSKSTLNRDLSALKPAMNKAVEWGSPGMRQRALPRASSDLSIHSQETCMNRLRIVRAAERAYGYGCG